MIIKRKIRFCLEKYMTCILGLGKRPEKAILFESFGGKQYSDNPRAISEKMHELYPEYKLYWSLSSNDDEYNIIPDYVEKVPSRGIKKMKALASVFAYVTNEANETNIYKKKNQFIIQTWHGDRVPKKVIYDAWENQERPIPVVDGKITDLCIAASDIGESVYHTAFHYNGKIFRDGMPRNDKLVNESLEDQKKIRRKIGISDEEKVLLFAPTFRDNISGEQNVEVDLDDALKILSSKGEKWKCLVRAHSASAGLNIEKNNNYINVSKYPDMADLLSISDMLITDYSSSAGDFILRHKPVILTMYDYDEYITKCRGFNFSPKDAGFIVAMNQAELDDILKLYTAEKYEENCNKIIDYFNITESGKSAKLICDIINDEFKKRVLQK